MRLIKILTASLLLVLLPRVTSYGANQNDESPATMATFDAIFEADKKESAKAKAEYQASANKLTFLLSKADSANPYLLDWVAQELAQNGSESAREALMRIKKARISGAYAEFGNAPNPRSTADMGLQVIEYAPDRTRLHMGNQKVAEEIAKHYSVRLNTVAEEDITNYLAGKIGDKDFLALELLVQYFPHKGLVQKLALEYRDRAMISLPAAFESPAPLVVEGAIQLVQVLNAENALPAVVKLLFVDLTPTNSTTICPRAIKVLKHFSEKSLPLIEQAFYVKNAGARDGIISIISSLKTPASQAVAMRLAANLKESVNTEDQELFIRLEKIKQN